MNKKLFIRLFEKSVAIGTTSTVLYLMILIAIYDSVRVYEDMKLILFLEIFLISIGLFIMIKGVFSLKDE